MAGLVSGAVEEEVNQKIPRREKEVVIWERRKKRATR
jgi:hypothetical protein